MRNGQYTFDQWKKQMRIRQNNIMLRIFETSKIISLSVACLMVINQGNVLSFNSWENKLKDTFNMTQTQGTLKRFGFEF